MNRVELIASVEVGSLIDQPDFGITDPTFSIKPDTAELSRQINQWEPRANANLSSLADVQNPDIRDVLIEVRAQ